MGLFDFLKKENKEPLQTPKESNVRKARYEYPIADFQKEFVISEIERLNALLQTTKYTKKLHMDSSKLTDDSYFGFEPFTVKTQKISKYPCFLHASSTIYMGYSVTIYYDVKDVACKGMIHISTKKFAYTIDFKNVNGDLKIMKVVTTDNKLNNEKLYHIMADGTVYAK